MKHLVHVVFEDELYQVFDYNHLGYPPIGEFVNMDDLLEWIDQNDYEIVPEDY